VSISGGSSSLNDGGSMSYISRSTTDASSGAMQMQTLSAAGGISDSGVGSTMTGPASSRSAAPCRSVAASTRWATVDR
jgi:hypothetical protein